MRFKVLGNIVQDSIVLAKSDAERILSARQVVAVGTHLIITLFQPPVHRLDFLNLMQ